MSFEDVDLYPDALEHDAQMNRIESKSRWRKQLAGYRGQSDGNRTEYSRRGGVVHPKPKRPKLRLSCSIGWTAVRC